MSEIEGRTAAEWSYRSGAWFAVFGTEVTILLPASQKGQVVDLWARVDDGADFDEVLDALLASGLSRIPGFVLVGAGADTTRFLLRGTGVSATVTAAGEAVTVEGGESRTWVERSVDDVTALTVTLPADDDQPTGEEDLPIVTGLVRVGRIDRPAATAVVAPAAPASVLAADPEPEPEMQAEPDVEPEPEPEPEAEVEVADEIVEDVMPAPTGGAHLLVEEPGPPEAPGLLEEPSPLDDGAAVTERADLGEVVALDEPGPLDEGAAVTEAAYPGSDAGTDSGTDSGADPDADPATEVMELGDELDAPADPAPAPEGWVTPWDSGTPAPAEPPAAEPDSLTSWGGHTEVAPASGWAPPPPADTPDVPAPPLPIGSWEPVAGGIPPAPPAPPAPPVPGIEHDGFTVAGAGEPPPPLVPPAPGAAAAGNQPVAKLLISDGQSIVVDRAVLIGRAPEARRFTSTEQPTLVTVPSRLHEISSTHIEVRPGTGADLGTAVVTDMGSTNGTVLVQPGLGPEDLKPGIAVQLIPGATINLGDGITIQIARP